MIERETDRLSDLRAALARRPRPGRTRIPITAQPPSPAGTGPRRRGAEQAVNLVQPWGAPN
jgi:hypothetical protein